MPRFRPAKRADPATSVAGGRAAEVATAGGFGTRLSPSQAYSRWTTNDAAPPAGSTGVPHVRD
jgi:hypothetical protein